MRVLLICSGHLGLALLQGLLDASRQDSSIALVGVMPWSFTKKGKSLVDDGETKLLEALRQAHIPTLSCSGANHYEFSEQLSLLKADVLLVGCWGEILKAHLFQREGLKVVNCHPSKLPAHRGSNPYASALMMGEVETGVTFHWINAAIDDGPIILQQTVPILPEDTGDRLRERCCEAARAMVPSLVLQLATLKPEDCSPQPQEGKSYYPQITVQDGAIDWSHPPRILLNRLRGLKPWLTSYSLLEGKLLYIFHWLMLCERPANPKWPVASAPGTVIHREGSTLWIQGAEPNQVFECQDYQLYFGMGFLPRTISRALSRLLIRPGHRFLRPYFNP